MRPTIAMPADAPAWPAAAAAATEEDLFKRLGLEWLTPELRERGLRLLYDAPRRGTSDSRINFVHPKDAGGVLVEAEALGHGVRVPGAAQPQVAAQSDRHEDGCQRDGGEHQSGAEDRDGAKDLVFLDSCHLCCFY